MKKSLTTLLLPVLMSGSCTVGPDFKVPLFNAGDKWKQNQSATPTALSDTWWRLYNDAELNRLVDLALQNNNDLALHDVDVHVLEDLEVTEALAQVLDTNDRLSHLYCPPLSSGVCVLGALGTADGSTDMATTFSSVARSFPRLGRPACSTWPPSEMASLRSSLPT